MQRQRSILATELRHSFDFECQLVCNPELVWEHVLRPALFLHVAAPLVRFRPVGIDRFPEVWSEGEYRGSMRLFGLAPIGWQAIVIEMPSRNGDVRMLRDRGYSPVLKEWDHRIEVMPRDGGTRYVDRVSFDAGVLTPTAAPMIRLFFRHRQRRLRALASAGFAALNP